MTYATSADMQNYCDVRQVCELVSDTDEAVLIGDLAANAVLTALLLAAEGDFNTAALNGNRYTVAQLEAMTGSGKQRLVELICRMTFLKLVRRRGQWTDQEGKWDEAINKQLTDLATGKAIFPIQDNLDASNAGMASATPRSVQIAGLLRDRVSNTYPQRQYRLQ